MLQYLPPAESPTFSSSAVHDSQFHLHPSPMQDPSTPRDASSSPGSNSRSTSTLNRTYTKVIHTDSFKEMLTITRSMDLIVADEDHDGSSHHLMLTRVLRPDRECVHEALRRSKSSSSSNSLANLISSYFRYSEETTSLCLTLRRSVAEARRLYRPIHTLVNDLPPIDSSLSQSHCDLAFEEFVRFNKEANPFPRSDSQTFNEIRDLFSDLKRQLERRLRKSSSKIRLVRPATAEPTAICCGGGVCTAYIPPKFARRELAYAAQLKVASRNTYVLKTDLDTLDRQVERLHNTVEDDKRFIRLGLKMGNDKGTVQEVLKELEKNHRHLVGYLLLLEETICTCFTTVNSSRSQLLQKITSSESSDS